MATDNQLERALEVFYEGLSCQDCGASVRIGEYECAHCAADFEAMLRGWLAGLIDRSSDRQNGRTEGG